VFYGTQAAGQQGLPNGNIEQSPAPSATTQLLDAPQNSGSPESAGEGEREPNQNLAYNRIVHSDSSVIMDTGYFSWIRIVFTLT